MRRSSLYDHAQEGARRFRRDWYLKGTMWSGRKVKAGPFRRKHEAEEYGVKMELKNMEVYR